jgi:ankyrin repeat protein
MDDQTKDKVSDLVFRRKTDELAQLIKTGEISVNDYLHRDRSILALATAANYTDVMKCLIENGADVNLMDSGNLGYTPIEWAARENHVEALQLLLNHKADINKGNTINTNALIGACIGAQKDALKLLLKKGANINHTDIYGRTAVHHICQNAKQWGGAIITETINGVTKELKNPRFKQHTEMLKLLLKNSAEVNLESNEGFTPLHYCADTNAHSFIPLLIKAGANVNAQNGKGYSPLHAASDKGHLESCKELIKGGANVNVVDHDGFTPILGATATKNAKLVKLLLKHGATKDIKAKISYGDVSVGDDALSLATKLKDTELIKLLKSA